MFLIFIGSFHLIRIENKLSLLQYLLSTISERCELLVFNSLDLCAVNFAILELLIARDLCAVNFANCELITARDLCAIKANVVALFGC